tara:strand:+ start:212 stop:403 length:192 start_codon:yes stop_codon:yes gene_type:complete
MPGSKKQNNMFKKSKGYIQRGNPFAVTSCGRRRNTGSPLYKLYTHDVGEAHEMYLGKLRMKRK